MKWGFGLLLILLLAIPTAAHDFNEVFFFYSDTCPHCTKEKAFLLELEEKYPELEIQRYEVSEDHDFFKTVNEFHDSIAVGVPRTIINGTVFVGFTETPGDMTYVEGYKAYNGYENQIEQAIVEYLNAEHDLENEFVYVEANSGPVWIVPLVLLFLYLVIMYVFRSKLKKRYAYGGLLAVIIIAAFYLSQKIPPAEIVSFARSFTFPVFTIILGLLDGFNPCAFAVLAILLSLLVHSKSRKRMALIGSIFIITSAVMYFIFIIVLLTIRAELLGQYKGLIRLAVGLIALTAGVINIKDFFFYKKGISLSISQKQMGKLMVRMRGIVNEIKEAKTARSLFVAIIGTIVLAALVNLVELGCTLILPVQYIEVLITNYGMAVGMNHYLFIALYCVVYVIPLFAILGSFLYSFKSERMTESKGRVLKLVGGLVMLGLGLILLFAPQLMVLG